TGDSRTGLVLYGQGLGTLAVFEQPADTSSSARDPLAALPAISINGARGHELATALGTVIRVTSGGVTYTLVGSVPAVAAGAGARALEAVAGFVEGPRFYPYRSGRNNLELCAAYDGGDAARRIDESFELVDLADRAKDRVGGYSHGMKQRLGIAAALLRNPRLLVLDEPTTGLDPAGMRA